MSTSDENWSIEELRDPRTGELMSTAERYQVGPSAKRLEYEDYDEEAVLECPACGWRGQAKDGDLETWTEVADVSCPHCSKMLLVISYPTPKEQ